MKKTLINCLAMGGLILANSTVASATMKTAYWEAEVTHFPTIDNPEFIQDYFEVEETFYWSTTYDDEARTFDMYYNHGTTPYLTQVYEEDHLVTYHNDTIYREGSYNSFFESDKFFASNATFTFGETLTNFMNDNDLHDYMYSTSYVTTYNYGYLVNGGTTATGMADDPNAIYEHVELQCMFSDGGPLDLFAVENLEAQEHNIGYGQVAGYRDEQRGTALIDHIYVSVMDYIPEDEIDPLYNFQNVNDASGPHHHHHNHGNQPVPEPATILLFGTGIASLISLRKRKDLREKKEKCNEVAL